MAGIFPKGGVPAGQALGADPSIGNEDVENCEGGAGFYPTNRCPAKFDPIAQNRLLSEIINLVLCAGLKYDCSQYDNLCEAIKKMVEDSIYGCLPREFPTVANACSIEQLVLSRDATGCTRIARYRASDSLLNRVSNRSVWGTNYPPQVHPRAGQTNVGTDIYFYGQLTADIAAGTVNNSVLYGPGNQNFLAEMQVTVACDSAVDIVYNQIVSFNPKQNNGDGASSMVVVLIDGQIVLNTAGQPIHLGEFTNFMQSFSSTRTFGLTAGAHTFRFLLVSNSPVAAAGVFVEGSATTGTADWSASIAVQ